MKSRKMKIRLFSILNIAAVAFSFLVMSPLSSFGGDLAEADGFGISADGVSYPYTDTFTISAYYSPLPCQQKYATGSYESDIRLNGGGVHGADGTDVYPGMVAAPKSYPFGTKLYIPGVGIVSVHDRGGAIVDSNGDPSRHDRLDIWMGYGDMGLKRALAWGKRTVDVTVYGMNDQLSEQIALAGYSSDESKPQECVTGSAIVATAEASSFVEKPESIVAVKMPSDGSMSVNLMGGANGKEVTALQNELKKLNYYRAEPTGVYDELTVHAVFKFQQGQKLIESDSDTGAGVFGPMTREKLNSIIALRGYTRLAIANAKEEKSKSAELPQETREAYLQNTLSYGTKGNDVKKLQEFLKKKGFFKSGVVTDYYGELTKEAVAQFQIANKIVSGKSDKGAGVVGNDTLKKINELA